MSPIERLLTVRQVQDVLQFSRTKVYQVIGNKKLTTVRLGRNVRVRESDLRLYIEQHQAKGG